VGVPGRDVPLHVALYTVYNLVLICNHCQHGFISGGRICKINEAEKRSEVDTRLVEHGSKFQIDVLFVAKTRH
jgi:hypothetical protein